MSLSTTQDQKRRHLQTLGYFATVTGFGALMSAFGPVLPALAGQTAADLSQMGVFFTMRAVGTLIGSLLGGWLLDRFPGHPVLAGNLFLLAAAFAATPFIARFWLLLLDGLVIGLTAGLLLVVANTLLVWVRSGNVGAWLNALSFFNSMGGFVIPLLIAGFLSATGMFSGAFGVVAAFLVLVGVWMLFVPSPPIRKAEEPSGSGARIPYGLVLVFTLIGLLFAGAEITFSSWLYTFVIALHPGAESTATLLNSVFWLMMALGRLLAIPVSSRLRPVIVLTIDFAGSLAGVAVLLLFSQGMAALWVGTIGTGLFMASLFPVLLDFVDRRIKITGKLNGIFFSAVSVGAMVFPWLAGVMFDARGPKAAMAVILVSLLAAAGIFAATARVKTTQEGQQY